MNPEAYCGCTGNPSGLFQVISIILFNVHLVFKKFQRLEVAQFNWFQIIEEVHVRLNLHSKTSAISSKLFV